MKNVLADGRWTQREVVCGCRWASTTARLCRSGVKGEGGWAGTAPAHPLTTPIPYAQPGQSKHANTDCVQFVFPLHSFLICHP